jgi:uncharacterized membrane protein
MIVSTAFAQTNGSPDNAGASLRTMIAPYMENVSAAAEITGVAVLVVGAVVTTAAFLWAMRRETWPDAFRTFRANLGRSILLGLEFMVAADIIRSVAIHPTYESLGTLAIIVAIRTFLSMSLEVEIEGKWPWRREEKA